MPGTATTEGSDGRKAVHDLARSPTRTDTTVAASLPESRRYRVKRILLGPPIVSEHLHGQRLGKPTALAVLSSDVMSSSAYATEQILRILVPIGGLAAFGMITPMTAAILAVLAVVTICYRDVVRAYPKAGGSYVVSRDNFGPNIAQVAGAALLISYTITVAVSVAAGADAIISAVPRFGRGTFRWQSPSSSFSPTGIFVASERPGSVFAIPRTSSSSTWRSSSSSARPSSVGTLPHVPHGSRILPIGHASGGLFLGVSAFFLLHAFANGRSAMTGTEAISNGVSIFREPQAKNARTTLALMSMILGTMFLGVSILARRPTPFRSSRAHRRLFPRLARSCTEQPRRHRLLLAASGDRADSHPGSQHELHGFPLPRELRC